MSSSTIYMKNKAEELSEKIGGIEGGRCLLIPPSPADSVNLDQLCGKKGEEGE